VRIRTVAIALVGAVVTVAGVGAWKIFGVEDIPEELEEIGDPSSIAITGVGSQPALEIAKLRGKTAFFVWVGVQSWGSEEGRKLNRALNRWILPESSVGFVVFDAEGLGFLQEKSNEYMEAFGQETRFPIYGDFEGQFRGVFKLPQGHHGFVVMGPEGDVLMRHSGGFQSDAELDEVRELLGGTEPEPGPPVPEFTLGELSREACETKPCALLFLGEPVAKRDVPGIDDGFEGEEEQEWAQMKKPAVRMAQRATALPLGDAALGAIVGRTEGLDYEGWTRVDEAPEVAQAFGVAPGETVWIVLRDGRVAFREAGLVQYYKVSLFADAVGVEFDDDD
jgi:hypothetical protein